MPPAEFLSLTPFLEVNGRRDWTRTRGLCSDSFQAAMEIKIWNWNNDLDAISACVVLKNMKSLLWKS